MKISDEVWKEKAANLAKRRNGNSSSRSDGRNIYEYCISKVKVGESVLDVGCGGMDLKAWLHEETNYVGIDPFPLNVKVIPISIEESLENFILPNAFDTVFCMASIDNCFDLQKALGNISKIAKQNIVILTGIDIEPDDLHTLKITMFDLQEAFKEDFILTHNELIYPKCYLLEFTRK